jgi:hypothetical protein
MQLDDLMTCGELRVEVGAFYKQGPKQNMLFGALVAKGPAFRVFVLSAP